MKISLLFRGNHTIHTVIVKENCDTLVNSWQSSRTKKWWRKDYWQKQWVSIWNDKGQRLVFNAHDLIILSIEEESDERPASENRD